jgi:hypothetical protein
MNLGRYQAKLYRQLSQTSNLPLLNLWLLRSFSSLENICFYVGYTVAIYLGTRLQRYLKLLVSNFQYLKLYIFRHLKSLFLNQNRLQELPDSIGNTSSNIVYLHFTMFFFEENAEEEKLWKFFFIHILGNLERIGCSVNNKKQFHLKWEYANEMIAPDPI